MEEWRDIPGWEGHYQASSEGRVKSLAREVLISKPRRGHRIVSEKILRPFTDSDGYIRVSLCRNGGSFKYGVHRLVALAFNGIAPDGFDVHHIDGDKRNNRCANLQYIDHGKHVSSHIGLSGHTRGSRQHLSKLDEKKVRKIRSKLALGARQKDVAREFGVSSFAVSCVNTGKTWAWVE